MVLCFRLQLPYPFSGCLELVSRRRKRIVEVGLMVDGGDQLVAQMRNFVAQIWVMW